MSEMFRGLGGPSGPNNSFKATGPSKANQQQGPSSVGNLNVGGTTDVVDFSGARQVAQATPAGNSPTAAQVAQISKMTMPEAKQAMPNSFGTLVQLAQNPDKRIPGSGEQGSGGGSGSGGGGQHRH